MKKDDLRNPNLVILDLCKAYGDYFDLKDFSLPNFDYSGYFKKNIFLSSENNSEAPYSERINVLEKFLSKIEENIKIPDRQKIRLCLNDAIRNAQSHGNNFDSSKSIGLGFKETSNSYDFFVEDEGGKIEIEFLPFITDVYNRFNRGETLESYYKFVNRPTKTKDNSGIGIIGMHYVFDNVSFYKSEKGGLLLNLEKSK